MKTLLLVAALALFGASAFAAETNATPEMIEAKYTRAIEGRTADILKVLALTNTAQTLKIHDTILAQYRGLKAWHDANDPQLKAVRKDTNAVAQIRASLHTLHAAFIASLSESLTPLQVDKVKDKMTYGKVQFTYAGYMATYPNLAVEHQQKILELLQQAREEAMDGGSAEEKTAVFTKCKGKINNYLSKQGIHPEKKPKAIVSSTNAPAK